MTANDEPEYDDDREVCLTCDGTGGDCVHGECWDCFGTGYIAIGLAWEYREYAEMMPRAAPVAASAPRDHQP